MLRVASVVYMKNHELWYIYMWNTTLLTRSLNDHIFWKWHLIGFDWAIHGFSFFIHISMADVSIFINNVYIYSFNLNLVESRNFFNLKRKRKWLVNLFSKYGVRIRFLLYIFVCQVFLFESLLHTHTSSTYI